MGYRVISTLKSPQAYHASRMDELKTHLENEGWALCPVKPSFSLRALSECAHLGSSSATTSRHGNIKPLKQCISCSNSV